MKKLHNKKYVIVSENPSANASFGKDNALILYGSKSEAINTALSQKDASSYFIAELVVGKVWKIKQEVIEVRNPKEIAAEKKEEKKE
jgi:hypothetical protein